MVPAESATSRRLRVVFVDHVARLSGGEIALLRLLPTLAQHVDVHVILGESGPLVPRLRAHGLSVEVLALPARLRDVRREHVQPHRLDPRPLLLLPRYVLRLRKRLRELRADVVHTNSLKAALYGGAAGRLSGVPVVWHVRDRIASDYLPRAAVALVHVAARVLPTVIVANSQETLSTLPRTGHERVIYNAVIPDSIEQTAGSQVRLRNELVVGVIGRLAAWKGQDVFLRAFAEAFRGTRVRARIVGSALFGEDAYADELVRLVRALDLEAQVEFTGFREDVWSELTQIDLLVHCSTRAEPFGQVVLEGMAAGVPVIAANAGGPAEMIKDGVNGVLTEPGDVAALAQAMQRLIQDQELRRRISERGRERSKDFTPARSAAAVLRAYARALRSDA